MKKLTGFIFPVLLGIIGLSIWGVGIVSFVHAVSPAGLPLAAPGVTTVTITNAGDYTIWHQTKGIIDGQFKSFSDQPPAGFQMKVTQQPGGSQIVLNSSYNGSVQSGDTRRVTVASVNFAMPGQYKIEISGLPEKHAFFLERARVMHEIMNFFACGFLGFVFVVAGVIWGVYALVRALKK